MKINSFFLTVSFEKFYPTTQRFRLKKLRVRKMRKRMGKEGGGGRWQADEQEI